VLKKSEKRFVEKKHLLCNKVKEDMKMKKIVFACDYRGVELKKQLYEYAKTLNFDIKDIGIEEGSSVDYIDITKELVNELHNEDAFGVIVCGSGQGVAMAANRSSDMRAAVCRTINDAEAVRSKLDANILCLGSKQTSLEEAIECLNTFIKTKFKGEKHERCVSKLYMNATKHTYSGINTIVRAVITHKEHVLLSTATGSNTQFTPGLYFLPGGHIDYKEPAIDALKRELKEEMDVLVDDVIFIGALECAWSRKENIYHELNLVYKVEVSDLNLENPPCSTEASIRFLWCPLSKLNNYKILPEKLIPIIQKATNVQSTKPLFLSQI
jgi:ribose 5-phosphate isomerase B